MHKLYTLFVTLLITATLAYAQGARNKISLEAADSLFLGGHWQPARDMYESFVTQHPEKVKALTWNRIGYCYHNLGNYAAAIKNYKKAVDAGPSKQLKPFLDSRLARAYSRLKESDKAFSWLDSAVHSGYTSLNEMDTLSDYSAIRPDPRFKVYHDKVRAISYPCSMNPKNHEFDFWIGEWDVYQTGTTVPKVGHSVVQSASGGCMILENWTALGHPHEGKSINYYDAALNYWEQDWIGSDGSPIRFTHGQYTDGAMRFTFESVQADGSQWPGRFYFYNQGPNQVRQFSEHSPDGGKTWTTNYDFTYVRKSEL